MQFSSQTNIISTFTETKIRTQAENVKLRYFVWKITYVYKQ